MAHNVCIYLTGLNSIKIKTITVLHMTRILNKNNKYECAEEQVACTLSGEPGPLNLLVV